MVENQNDPAAWDQYVATPLNDRDELDFQKANPSLSSLEEARRLTAKAAADAAHPAERQPTQSEYLLSVSRAVNDMRQAELMLASQ